MGASSFLEDLTGNNLEELFSRGSRGLDPAAVELLLAQEEVSTPEHHRVERVSVTDFVAVGDETRKRDDDGRGVENFGVGVDERSPATV